MKRAFYASDSTYDGIFYTAVKTTNIFCRPSCKVRKPLEKNISFYTTVKDVLFAGYNPCKKCKPLEIPGSHPEWVKELLGLIEKSHDKRIRDREIQRIGIEPSKARRYFVKNFGMTFQAFQRSNRLSFAIQKIREGEKLDEVVFSNGYNSHSGFRNAFRKTFGKPPGKSKTTDCIVTSQMESPLGPIIIGSTSAGLCFLEFNDRRMFEKQIETLRKRFKLAIVSGKNEHTVKAITELKKYFKGELKFFSVPLVFPGTEFHVKVWSELLKISYGRTISYEELAHRVGIPNACRAVGTANGMNRIAIIIPCHRVINKSGKLGGYGGGLRRKEWLLALEQSHLK